MQRLFWALSPQPVTFRPLCLARPLDSLHTTEGTIPTTATDSDTAAQWGPGRPPQTTVGDAGQARGPAQKG